MNAVTSEQKAVAFADKVYAHMITKMANEALANFEAKKLELDNLNVAIAQGEQVVKVPSALIAELSFFSGQINAYQAVLAELESK